MILIQTNYTELLYRSNVLRMWNLPLSHKLGEQIIIDCLIWNILRMNENAVYNCIATTGMNQDCPGKSGCRFILNIGDFIIFIITFLLHMEALLSLKSSDHITSASWFVFSLNQSISFKDFNMICFLEFLSWSTSYRWGIVFFSSFVFDSRQSVECLGSDFNPARLGHIS